MQNSDHERRLLAAQKQFLDGNSLVVCQAYCGRKQQEGSHLQEAFSFPSTSLWRSTLSHESRLLLARAMVRTHKSLSSIGCRSTYQGESAGFCHNVLEVSRRVESEFEKQVLRKLIQAGYRVVPQWHVGAYRIDLVVEGDGKRLAVECDGDRWHPVEKLAEDMARQAILYQTAFCDRIKEE